MGLDMYLYAKRFIWHNEEELRELINKCITCPVSDEPKYVIYEAMYWRKANAIHAWFVKNVQDGEDDCGHYYVSIEDLTKLRDICAAVIENTKLKSGSIKIGEVSTNGGEFIPKFKDGLVIENVKDIEELLPTTSGFFFGSTDYDEYYLRDIKYTKEGLDKILNSDMKDWDFEYHSSW